MSNLDDVEIEYVPETLVQDELYQSFADVFKKFSQIHSEEQQTGDAGDRDSLALVAKEDDQDENQHLNKAVKEVDDKNELDKKPSKRKLKQLTRMTVAELKQKVERPELVEIHDVTAKDPVFLILLKSTKNSVPVPRHWSSKRKYLQGKRGIEKPAFLLPDFIRQTGIMEMRDSVQEKDSAKSLKAKVRERVQPKMGKIQMDYQQLHDAFFKWQTKPKLSMHGDLYYEGKEFEKKFKTKPGELSNDLRKALGMPIGPDANHYPPPWWPAMKRLGLPPAYPYLKLDYG